MVKYGISKFGRQIVVSEELIGDLPTIRVIFIVITIIVGIIAVMHSWRQYFLLLSRQKRFAPVATVPFLVGITYFVYILNIVIHSAHYADNIARPVDYYEPRWLYDKYLLSTMEITFFVNFPITIAGSFAIAHLFRFEKSKLIICKSPCYYMIGFIFGSLLTVLHYRNEPPSSYSSVVNFTIAGEGAVALTLTALIANCFRLANDDTSAQDNVEEEILLEQELHHTPSGRVSRRSPHRKT